MEEAVRFELTGPIGPTVFKTVAINHSATLPYMAPYSGIEPLATR
jgi:hypothetical protein